MAYLERLFQATEEENRRVILSTLLPRPGATVVDLGCGDGSLTARVGIRIGAGHLIGVETNGPWIAEARERGVDVLEADLRERLPLADGSVDVVHSNQVIEHLAGTDHFMREIRRILRDDGYAVLSTNNLASWHNIASLALGYQPTPCHVSDEVIVGNPANFVDGSPGAAGQMHLRVFTGRALAALAARHGLRAEVQRTAGYYPLPPRLASMATSIDRRHGAFLVQRLRPTSAPRQAA